MAFGNQNYGGGSDPVATRKAAQRKSAIATVLGKDSGAPDSDATSPALADGSDGPLPASDPSINYMGPDQGPFACSNCNHFVGDGQPCEKVSDPVQSDGCCNAFESAGGGSDASKSQPNPSETDPFAEFGATGTGAGPASNA